MVDGERPVLEDVLRIWTRSYACSSIGFAVVRGHQPVFACPSHCWSGDIDGAVWTDMGTDVGKGRRGDCVQSAVDREEFSGYWLRTVVACVAFMVAKVTAETSSPMPHPGSVPVKASPADKDMLKMF
jgi:hypothetical protein